MSETKQSLPNNVGTLVCGILSLVFVCCWGAGLILGIVALAISARSQKLLRENPTGYSGAGNHKAGRVCAIIGLAFSIIYLLYWIFWVVVWGNAVMYSPAMYW